MIVHCMCRYPDRFLDGVKSGHLQCKASCRQCCAHRCSATASSETATPVSGTPMTMHDGNDADERIALHKDDRVWEAFQQLAAYAEFARQSDHGSALGSRSLKRPHRRFELIPELGS